MYTIRSERLLMKQLDYNMLLGWFVSLSMDHAVWAPAVFTKNRGRLLEGDATRAFLEQVVERAREGKLLSNENFAVEGTQVEAWAGHIGFKKKDEKKQKKPADPGNPSVDVRGEKRTNDTRLDDRPRGPAGPETVWGDLETELLSTTAPEYQGTRIGNCRNGKNFRSFPVGQKGKGAVRGESTLAAAQTQAGPGAERCPGRSRSLSSGAVVLGHVLMENRNGLAVDGRVTQATGRAECEAGLEMAASIPTSGRATLRADKAFDRRPFVQGLRDLGVMPHVAQKVSCGAVDGRSLRHPGCLISQGRRKRVEEIFGRFEDDQAGVEDAPPRSSASGLDVHLRAGPVQRGADEELGAGNGLSCDRRAANISGRGSSST